MLSSEICSTSSRLLDSHQYFDIEKVSQHDAKVQVPAKPLDLCVCSRRLDVKATG